MKYKRITKRKLPFTTMQTGYNWLRWQIYNRLAKLEDKIEAGELISTVQDEQSEQEIKFFAEHNAVVRKEVVKECLHILHNTGVTYLYDTHSWDGIEVIDIAIKRLAEKYNIDTEERE